MCGKGVGLLVGQMEAKAAPAEGRAGGRSRWTWSTGAETAGMCGEAGIKDRGLWQTAEREERRAQTHSAEQSRGRRSAGWSRWASAGCRCREVFSEAGGHGFPCASWGLEWMGREWTCLHLFAISACPSFINLSPLSPAALAPECAMVGAGGGLCTPTLCVHTHKHTALLTKPFCSILTVTAPSLCLHLPEVSRYHPEHHGKPMRAGLGPCSSFLCLAPRLLSTGRVMAMPGNSNCIPVCDLAAELQQPQLPLSAPIQSTVSNSPPRAGALSVKQQGVTRIILPPSLSLLPSSTDPHPQHIPLAPSGAAPAHPPQPLTKSCL